MEKLSKKGFSMIELLFVMIIVAVIIAIAIPTFSSDSAKMTSMKSDAVNTVNTIKNEQNKAEIGSYEIGETSAHNDQLTYTIDGTYGNSEIVISKENEILFTDLRDTCKDGFSIQVSDITKEVKSVINYNSCNDTDISVYTPLFDAEDTLASMKDKVLDFVLNGTYAKNVWAENPWYVNGYGDISWIGGEWIGNEATSPFTYTDKSKMLHFSTILVTSESDFGGDALSENSYDNIKRYTGANTTNKSFVLRDIDGDGYNDYDFAINAEGEPSVASKYLFDVPDNIQMAPGTTGFIEFYGDNGNDPDCFTLKVVNDSDLTKEGYENVAGGYSSYEKYDSCK